jgi:multidrug efflux system outer membrane protein
MTNKLKINKYVVTVSTCMAIIASCKVPAIVETTPSIIAPKEYAGSSDTTNSVIINWRTFFSDKALINLIDTALQNNQELKTTLQEIEIARNDIRMRKGAMLPTVGLRGGVGVEKVGRYTSQGAGDATTDIAPGKEMPDPLGDFAVTAYANWEVDIWKKLRTAKKAAITRYLSSVEGTNFVRTSLIAEVANSYYELVALDNQLTIIRQNIDVQNNALEIVKIQKDASRSTELAVKKFEAEVLKSTSLQFDILQQIKETENRINLLLGRYPQPIARDTASFLDKIPTIISTGIPSQLLINRPDIKQAELDLTAAKLDLQVARKEFYPSLGISSGVGIQAFNPSYFVKLPSSLLYSLATDLAGPLINKNAIQAEFSNANSRQLQALYNYERTILNAYLEVATQMASIDNLKQNYHYKSKQVAALNTSIDVANDLFKFARADYFEVLMTQRDALEAKLELVETKKQQLNAVVNIYRDLGGGWK